MHKEEPTEEISKGFISWVCPRVGRMLKKKKKSGSLEEQRGELFGERADSGPGAGKVQGDPGIF